MATQTYHYELGKVLQRKEMKKVLVGPITGDSPGGREKTESDWWAG